MRILTETGARLLTETGFSILTEQDSVGSFMGLSDVDTTGLIDGDVFVWDATAGKLKPASTLTSADIVIMVKTIVAEALTTAASAI